MGSHAIQIQTVVEIQIQEQNYVMEHAMQQHLQKDLHGIMLVTQLQTVVDKPIQVLLIVLEHAML